MLISASGSRFPRTTLQLPAGSSAVTFPAGVNCYVLKGIAWWNNTIFHSTILAKEIHEASCLESEDDETPQRAFYPSE
jgi:hypothetical protein